MPSLHTDGRYLCRRDELKDLIFDLCETLECSVHEQDTVVTDLMVEHILDCWHLQATDHPAFREGT